MAKDGTNRGGSRVRVGAKPDPLNEKLAKGVAATRLEDPLNEPFDFEGSDIGDGALLAGETMPEPSDYLSDIQRDGKPPGADLVYRETWQRLDARGCSQFRRTALDRVICAGVRALCAVRERDFPLRLAGQASDDGGCDRVPVRRHVAVV